MVAFTPTQLLGAAALCVSALAPFAHGSSLMANPVSIVAEEERLNAGHPAYGAAIPNEVAAYVVEEREIVDVSGKTTTRTRSRVLEASSKDMLRLEEHFGTKMETNLKTMQSATYMQATFGQAPWPSSYWPIYQDGINARWDANQPSPADKYAMAFGLNVKQFADTISRNNGILSQNRRRACAETSECNSLKDGSICGKRAGEAKGYCIPGWFGICHAWAPAAILEKEPVCAVQRGNVTFQVFDIKALITQLYDGANMAVVFTGARYNGADEPADLDAFGRYKDDARRDLGPGFFHIAMTNIMGKFKQSLILDVTAGAAVWNQPVRSFKVLELKEVGVKQASEKYFKSTTYPFNSAMKSLAFARTKVSWIVEGVEDGPLVANGRIDAYTHSATYEYLLELDANRNIIGGEWVGASRYEHPDFLWFPKGKPAANVVTNVGMKYKDIAQLLEDSIKCAPTTPAPTTATPVTTAPTPTTVAPAPTTATPATTAPAPTTTTPVTTAPTPTTATPVTTAPAPTTTTPVTTAPAPTTTTPVTTAPAPTTTTPVTTAPAPTTTTPVTTAPTPTTTTPVTTAPTPTTATPDTVTPVPSQCGSSQVGVDFYGDDLRHAYGGTHAECCALCSKTAGCKAYTYVREDFWGGSSCYLKRGMGVSRPHAGAISGVSTPLPGQPTPAPVACHTAAGGSCGNALVGVQCCPAGSYCQPWNPWYYQCLAVPAKCATQQVDVDFYGDDLKTVYGVGPHECCRHCAQTEKCKAYTFVNYNEFAPSMCYLKTGSGKQRSKAGAVSALLKSSD